jgi:HPt (histidine-containing phosphotransfer) domain-containing protein
MNAIHSDHKLRKASPLAQCVPLTLVNPTDRELPQAREACSKLQDVTEEARPHLRDGEFQELEELLAEYEELFAVNSEDQGRNTNVYDPIDTRDWIIDIVAC